MAQNVLVVFMEKKCEPESDNHSHAAQPWDFCIKSFNLEREDGNFRVCINLEPLLSAVIVVDKHDLVRYLNRAAAQQIGIEQQAAYGRKLTDLYQTIWLDPEDERAAKKALEEKGCWTGETIQVKKNGEKANVESTVIALTSVDGERVGLLNTMREVTRQKQREAELRESEARFRAIVEHSPAIITVLDADFRVLYVNSSIERIIGVPPDAIMRKKWATIDMPENLRQSALTIARKAFATGKTVEWEQKVATPLGAKTLETYVVPESAKNGTIETLLGITVDITERKQMEKALRGYSKDLEILVNAATQKLLESERFAAIGQTAGMVGHDIRNPLQAIAGELYLQKCEIGSLPDSEVKQNLQDGVTAIVEQVAYISKIVSDLQDFARPQAPQFKESDCEKILQNVLSSIEIPENIEVTYSIGNELANFVTDSDFIKRSLTNLILNAVQAMPKGGQINITGACKEQTAVITVEDTGEGIPKELKEKIFKPLFTTKSKGQGFGLAVVKRLVEMLGGDVMFESAKGKGTKFTLRIPQKNA
jgi:PAS domain S-box-containing protein